jgi:hypothetical protein
MGGENA